VSVRSKGREVEVNSTFFFSFSELGGGMNGQFHAPIPPLRMREWSGLYPLDVGMIGVP